MIQNRARSTISGRSSDPRELEENLMSFVFHEIRGGRAEELFGSGDSAGFDKGGAVIQVISLSASSRT